MLQAFEEPQVTRYEIPNILLQLKGSQLDVVQVALYITECLQRIQNFFLHRSPVHFRIQVLFFSRGSLDVMSGKETDESDAFNHKSCQDPLIPKRLIGSTVRARLRAALASKEPPSIHPTHAKVQCGCTWSQSVMPGTDAQPLSQRGCSA